MLRDLADPADHPGMKTLQRHMSTGVSSEATPYVPVVTDRLAAIHRRAGIAAILRDERLHIAIDENGAVTARFVPGVEI